MTVRHALLTPMIRRSAADTDGAGHRPPPAQRGDNRVHKITSAHASEYDRSSDTLQAPQRQTNNPGPVQPDPLRRAAALQELARGVGQRIMAIREELGLNQSDMARILGVKRSRYVNWEAGRHLPADELAIIRLCDISDATLDWIYRGKQAGMPSALGLRLEARVAGAPPPR